MKKFLSLIVLSSLLITACAVEETTNLTESGSIQYVESFAATVENVSYNWEDINIEGGLVSHSFPFENSSDQDLLIKTASTSCMCTTAEIELESGETSPLFSMHEATEWGQLVAPGEKFEVNVVFDPMAHGPDAVGTITRSVFIETSASNLEEGVLEIKVSGDVLYADDYESKQATSAENIEVEELAEMMVEKDFYLLDVHIPEQTHIPGTDAFIPYDDISSYTVDLPEDKDAEILVYCRSGSMSAAASVELIEMGYTNVKNVLGGIQAYDNYKESNVETLSPDELTALIDELSPVLIDVHVDGPHHEHIEGTDHFLSIEEFYTGSDSLPEDTSAQLVLYSIDENISLAAAFRLQMMGYENIYHLEGGTENYLNHIQ